MNKSATFIFFAILVVPLQAIDRPKENCCSQDLMFKMATTGCLVALLVPPISSLMRDMQETWRIAKTKPLGPLATAFVQYTLKLHGYTKEECKDIVFRQGDRFECIDRVISVQFNDNELLAIMVRLSSFDRKSLVTQLVQHGLKLIQISKLDIIKTKVPNTPLPMIVYEGYSKIESQQMFFKKMILEWQASILHEMSHARHQDTTLYRTAIIGGYIPLLWSMDYIAPTIKKKIIMLPIIAGMFYKLIPLGLGKYCEWRADQEVIQRAKNPLMLQTESEFYNALEALTYNNRQFDLCNGSRWQKLQAKIVLAFPWIDEIVDEHPSHSRRAKYFKKAFQKKNKDSRLCMLNREIDYDKK